MLAAPRESVIMEQTGTMKPDHMPALPHGYTARPARHDDAPAVAALYTACRGPLGESPVSVDEVLDDWAEIDNLADEMVVVLAPDGRLVAEADVVSRGFVRVSVYGSVHPEEEGRGLGSFLVSWGERWIGNHLDLAPAGVQVVLEFYTNAANRSACRLLESRGYPLVRTVYIMQINMDEPPPTPAWPEGIQVRAFRPGEDDKALFEVGEEAFSDMWSRPRGTLEGWIAPTRAEGFDPSLWFLPLDTGSGAVEGFCLCTIASGSGWVRSLGVRPEWRKRGLGLALLRHAFGQFYRRGIRQVELSVDADSPTGAPRLYTRAGMHVTQSYRIYRREVRPGAAFTGDTLGTSPAD
jgi:GNAT superfamily N-acetyltransferase